MIGLNTEIFTQPYRGVFRTSLLCEEAYLQPSQTSTIKLFCEDRQRLKAVWVLITPPLRVTWSFDILKYTEQKISYPNPHRKICLFTVSSKDTRKTFVGVVRVFSFLILNEYFPSRPALHCRK